MLKNVTNFIEPVYAEDYSGCANISLEIQMG